MKKFIALFTYLNIFLFLCVSAKLCSNGNLCASLECTADEMKAIEDEKRGFNLLMDALNNFTFAKHSIEYKNCSGASETDAVYTLDEDTIWNYRYYLYEEHINDMKRCACSEEVASLILYQKCMETVRNEMGEGVRGIWEDVNGKLQEVKEVYEHNCTF